MDAKAQREAQLFIASARADIEEGGRQLQATKDDIARALKAAEDLTVEAHRLHERTKELEMDEEVLKKSQEAAVQEKLGAEKRLMEVGGYERVVRVMQKELRDAKSELQRTKDEKTHIVSEEKKLHGELVNLHAILQKIQAHSAKLQEEYNAVVKDKHETEDKLHRLSLILQKTLEASSLASSPPPAPARSIPNVSPSKSATTASSSLSSTPPTSTDSSASKSPPRAPSPTRKLLAFLSPRSRSASTAEQHLAPAENKL